MKKKFFTREVKVGLMVIVAIFILYFGLNFLKGIDIFQKTAMYYGQFENIGGLVPSAPVYIKGYKAGQVEEVNYDFSKKESFNVKISLDNHIKLPMGTVMQLADEGLMGGKVINLIYNPVTAGQPMHKGNDILPTSVNTGLMTTVAGELMPKIENVATQADSLLRAVRVLVERKEINNSLSSIEKTTSDLAVSSAQMKGMLNNQLPSILKDVNSITSDFKQISGNLKNIDFAKTFASIDYTLKNLQIMSDRLNSNEGSLGLLMKDKTLYNNLSNTLNDADKLMIDLKENPKRYVHFSLIGSNKK
ncbi:MAG: Mammalian cell entry related domain protein [Bacteroidetes bacterium]|nr:Mammalian cell entry related domain protein [Bacteroidota bacterium]